MQSTTALPILSCLLTCLTLCACGQPRPEPPSRRLQDIPVFRERKSAQVVNASNGASVARDPDGSLPADDAVKYDDLPSLRLEIRGDAQGDWQVLFAANDWRTFDLSEHWRRGALEFNVRGAKGGETFAITLTGKRVSGQVTTAPFAVASRFPITTQWRRVRIPLRDLVPDRNAFPLNETFFLTVQKAGGGAQTFWLNNVRFTSPDLEPGFPAVKVNLLGYTPKAVKRALVSGFAEELKAGAGSAFRVLRLPDRQPAFTGRLTLVAERDEISGEKVLRADFSALTTPGRYLLEVEGAGRSPEFRIETELYAPLLRDALRYFYLQRSGMPLDRRCAGIFARGEGHPQDRSLPHQSDPSRRRDVHGGWYDAGDYGKYVSMAAKPVSDLLWAYETFPDLFPDGMANIPESGNGVPDILDEVRWELDWIIRMQDRESGGFYQKVWPNNASVTPDRDRQARFVYDKVGDQGNVRPTAATAAAVAVLAHGSVVLRPFDARYADLLLERARQGWAYLEANPHNIVARGMTGAVEDDRSLRLWAAGALYRAAGEASLRDYFLQRYAAQNRAWNNPAEAAYSGDMAVFAVLNYLRRPDPDPAVRRWFAENFQRWRANMQERMANGVWGNYLHDWNYFWGSNSLIADTTILLTLGSRAIGTFDESIVAGARSGLNYLLGVNPLQFSYISGYGANSVKRIYSCIWTYDGIDPIPPGYLAGGPNRYEGRVFSRFTAKCYRDSPFEWTTNENAIYWNSALVFLTALVHAERNR
jgi:hypothetical protein